MGISRYGFILKAKGYNKDVHNCVLKSDFFYTQIVAVSSIQEAISAAKELIENGVQLIELCGGFEAEGAEMVIQALNCQIPIGFVTFTQPEQQKLLDLISQKETGE